MERAILYTLRESEIPVESSQDFLEVHKSLTFESPFLVGDYHFTERSIFERIALPLHRVRKCPRLENSIFNPTGLDNQTRYEEYFFAVEPALEEILRVPFKEEVFSLGRELGSTKNKLKRYEEEVTNLREELSFSIGVLEEYKKKISDFNKKSLLRRLIQAFNGI